MAILYPFAVGPDLKLLPATGGAMLWIAALLAALLPIERLIRPDWESGHLDQLALRGWADEAVAALKIAAHWLGFGPPLLLAALIGAALFDLDGTHARHPAGGAGGRHPRVRRFVRHHRRADRARAGRQRSGG